MRLLPTPTTVGSGATSWRRSAGASRCTRAVRWFWEVPDRIETAGALRAAVRAARLIDGLASTDLETRLVGDLALLDGAGDGSRSLADGPRGGRGNDARARRIPSARGLRATG